MEPCPIVDRNQFQISCNKALATILWLYISPDQVTGTPEQQLFNKVMSSDDEPVECS